MFDYYKEEKCECGGKIGVDVTDEPITQVEWIWVETETCLKCGKQNITERRGKKFYGY